MPNHENDLETDSDDEDEMVEQAKREIISKEFQERNGFWKMDK